MGSQLMGTGNPRNISSELAGRLTRAEGESRNRRQQHSFHVHFQRQYLARKGY